MTHDMQQLGTAQTPFFGQMTEDDYRAAQRRGSIGGSALGALIDGSPLHLVARRNFTPSAQMLFGTAAHARILEPAEYGKRYRTAATAHKVAVDYGKDEDGQWWAVAEDGKCGPFDKSTEARARAGEWRVTGCDDWFRTRKDADAACSAGDDRDALSQSDVDRLEAMAAAVEQHQSARALTTAPGLLVERSILWTDEATGVRCSGRADAYDPTAGVLVDLKTHGRPVPPQDAGKWIANAHYHVQLAHYIAGMRAAGVKVASVAIVAVESMPPHAVAVYRMSDQMLAVGEHLRQLALTKWRHADLEIPAYGHDPHDVDLPAWAIPTDFDRAAFDAWAAESERAQRDALLAKARGDLIVAKDKTTAAIHEGDFGKARAFIADAEAIAADVAELTR